MTSSPLVTVYIPVYNREKFVREAVNSIIHQTFTKFELIIIDDGSSDDSLNIIRSFSDDRIIVIKNTVNLGIRKTANIALKMARGKYIVRQDSDDISSLDRLQKQVDFMEAHPEIGVAGGQLQLFGTDNNIWSFPTDNNHVKAGLIFESTVSQPSSIIRRQLIEDGFLYNETGMSFGEDYEFWHSLKSKTQFANSSDILVYYRRGEQNITVQLKDKGIQLHSELHKVVLRDFGIDVTDRQLMLHHVLRAVFPKNMSKDILEEAYSWKNRLIAHNNIVQHYPVNEFTQLLNKKWERLFYYLVPYGRQFVFKYFSMSGIKIAHMLYYLKYYFNKLTGRKL